mmetsp:Transcript_16629/g.40924  ORF Transcript_16629/g.40924 Transcript_16629/m.40924 type:complete len:80 (-) Transcript_16629:1200-1439(-)
MQRPARYGFGEYSPEQYVYPGLSYRGMRLGERMYAAILGLSTIMCKKAPSRGSSNLVAKSGIFPSSASSKSSQNMAMST